MLDKQGTVIVEVSYTTDNGEKFTNMREARGRQDVLDFKKWYEDKTDPQNPNDIPGIDFQVALNFFNRYTKYLGT